MHNSHYTTATTVQPSAQNITTPKISSPSPVNYSLFTPIVIIILSSIIGAFFRKDKSTDNKSKDLSPSVKSSKTNALPPDKRNQSQKDKQTKQNDDSLDKTKLDSEINDIVHYIGISNLADTPEITGLFIDNKLKSAIDMIAKHLSLEDLRITVTRSNKKKLASDGRIKLAEVNVSNVGIYGSRQFKSRPCHITIYNGCEANVDRFIYIMAHELNHIVLHSVKKPCKDENDEERLTDLAVIFSGFKGCYARGRKIDNNTAGYLNDAEAEYACRKYDEMLNTAISKRETIFAELDIIKKQNADKIRFLSAVERILNGKTTKVSPDDMQSINICLSCVDENTIKKYSSIVKQLDRSLSAKRMLRFEEIEKNKVSLIKLLDNLILPDFEHIIVLTRYV